MKKLFSIAIPTWEINGKGVEYLEYSFNRILNQTFDHKMMEIVISDHSIDDEIGRLCNKWRYLIDITYTKCEVGRGNIAPNLNNALRHCEGSYIKILFQDDFLYDENSMMRIYNAILREGIPQWLVTGCAHTKDMETLYDFMVPRWHPYIHLGYNTISCPSVLTIKNDNVLYFDESLNWLVDVEYYKRMYDNFGLPLIVSEPCIINRDSDIRTTNIITEKQKQEEVQRVSEMYDQPS